jgi:ABC-type transport system involved in multi-copper enzyme maturation permease subunit
LSLAAAYLAFATVGSEFTFGTIRPSLIVAPSRRVFLASRCLVLVGLVVAGGLALVVAGALLPAILGLVSGRMPSVPLVPATGLGVELLARMLAAGAFASVGLFFAVATRSLIGATLATLVYLLLETIVSSSTRSGGLAWIGQITVSGSTTAVIEAAHRGAGGVLPVDEVAQLALLAEPVIDPLVSLAVALGWIAALVVISLVVFERVDVTD